MELSKLAQKPQLIKLTITDEEIVKTYGDELEFYMYDRQPLDVFAKLASAKEGETTESMVNMIQEIILDKDGEKVMKEGLQLPMDVIGACMKVAGEKLGK